MAHETSDSHNASSGLLRPPRIQVRTSISSDVCDRSGSPPCTLTVSFTNLEAKPITLFKTNTILDLDIALTSGHIGFLDIEDGRVLRHERMEPCLQGRATAAYLGTSSTLEPRPEQFLSLDAHQQLNVSARINFPAAPGRLWTGFLGLLEDGKTYRVLIDDGILVQRWAYGSMDRVFTGDRPQPIVLELLQGEATRFKVVP